MAAKDEQASVKTKSDFSKNESVFDPQNLQQPRQELLYVFHLRRSESELESGMVGDDVDGPVVPGQDEGVDPEGRCGLLAEEGETSVGLDGSVELEGNEE